MLFGKDARTYVQASTTLLVSLARTMTIYFKVNENTLITVLETLGNKDTQKTESLKLKLSALAMDTTRLIVHQVFNCWYDQL